LMRIGLPHAGRGHPPRAGPAPAVPPLVAGEPRGGRKRRLPLDLGYSIMFNLCGTCLGLQILHAF
jgi:hypothetical protein